MADARHPAGWYRDLRWWDGSSWTEHVQRGAAPPAAPARRVPVGTPAETPEQREAQRRASRKGLVMLGVVLGLLVGLAVVSELTTEEPAGVAGGRSGDYYGQTACERFVSAVGRPRGRLGGCRAVRRVRGRGWVPLPVRRRPVRWCRVALPVRAAHRRRPVGVLAVRPHGRRGRGVRVPAPPRRGAQAGRKACTAGDLMTSDMA